MDAESPRPRLTRIRELLADKLPAAPPEPEQISIRKSEEDWAPRVRRSWGELNSRVKLMEVGDQLEISVPSGINLEKVRSLMTNAGRRYHGAKGLQLATTIDRAKFVLRAKLIRVKIA